MTDANAAIALLEKMKALNGIRIHDLCVIGAKLSQVSRTSQRLGAPFLACMNHGNDDFCASHMYLLRKKILFFVLFFYAYAYATEQNSGGFLSMCEFLKGGNVYLTVPFCQACRNNPIGVLPASDSFW